VIYYRGLRFPQREVVVLLLESDAAYTSLSGHSAGKVSVLVLDCCYKALDAGEHVFLKALNVCSLHSKVL